MMNVKKTYYLYSGLVLSPILFLPTNLALLLFSLQFLKVFYLACFKKKNPPLYSLLKIEFICSTLHYNMFSPLIKNVLTNEALLGKILVANIYVGIFTNYLLLLSLLALTISFFLHSKINIYKPLVGAFLLLLSYIFFKEVYHVKTLNHTFIALSTIYIFIYIGFQYDLRKITYSELTFKTEILLTLGAIYFLCIGLEAVLMVNIYRDTLFVSYIIIFALGLVIMCLKDETLQSLFYNLKIVSGTLLVLLILFFTESTERYIPIHISLILIFLFIGFLIKRYRYSTTKITY